MIYLDHAAATPMDPAVLRAMRPYFSERFYNPSATYLPAQEIHKTLEKSRADVAALLGAKPAEIIFTAGGTEADNIAIHGIMSQYPKGEILVSAIEHEAVLKPAAAYSYKEIPVGPDGLIDVRRLAKLISDRTVLISVMYANNEIGTIEPVREIGRLVTQVKKARQSSRAKLPLFLHTDACQAANYLDLHVSRLGVDLMTLNGGKIYGPKQSGALYVRAGTQPRPFILGGGQEQGIRSGTENVAAIVGFTRALQLAQACRHEEGKRLKGLQQTFFKLLDEHIPSALINGSRGQRLANNLHITIPGQDNERLLIRLEERGVLAATGSACSAAKEEFSHVLKALGQTQKQARASLRLTMGRLTTEKDVEDTIEALLSAIE